MTHYNIDYSGTRAPQALLAQITRAALRVVIASVFCVTSLATQAEQKSPEEVYAGHSSNLQQLPQGWVDDSPVELVVSFNLDSAPNSAESNLFLKTWYQSISRLPYDVDLEVKRLVSPKGYTYAVSLTFNNWKEYREYETSEDFLAYFYGQWKPRVREAEEHVYILEAPAKLMD